MEYPSTVISFFCIYTSTYVYVTANFNMCMLAFMRPHMRVYLRAGAHASVHMYVLPYVCMDGWIYI